MAKKKEVPEWEAELLNMKDLSDFVTLQCDEHRLTVKNALKDRTVLMLWYVNDEYKGEWIDKESPIGQKFGMEIYAKSKAVVEMIKRINGRNKKKADEEIKAYQSKVLMYNFYWKTPQALIKKLKKTCKSITLIDSSSFPF